MNGRGDGTPLDDESQPLRQGLCRREDGSLGSLAQWDVNSTLDGSNLGL